MAQASLTEALVAGNATPAPIPFAFESHQIRTVINGDGKPWFVAKDVAASLGVGWSGHTLDNIPADWQRMVKLTTPRMKHGEIVANTKQKTKLISEPAVYKLAFRSNKPEADRFTNWIASEVIPTLRRTGKYEVCPAPSRLTTAKERNALTGLVNRYVGQLPGGPHQEAYKATWRKVHEVMGIGSIEELTVEQLPRAVMLMKSLVDAMALPDAKPPKALPARPWPDLPPRHWNLLIGRFFRAAEVFSKDLDTIKAEAFAPFKLDRETPRPILLDAALQPSRQLFDVTDEHIRTLGRCVYDSILSLQRTWGVLQAQAGR
jgi:prophage antirepressor-like protein